MSDGPGHFQFRLTPIKNTKTLRYLQLLIFSLSLVCCYVKSYVTRNTMCAVVVLLILCKTFSF